jgi:hypothetical protein
MYANPHASEELQDGKSRTNGKDDGQFAINSDNIVSQ